MAYPDHLPPDRSGFTLIELSIVLVIVAFIVGGILVGKDMIESAQIRSTLSQLDKFKTAVNAFQSKYNALPGDIAAAQAAAFGFTPRSGAPGHGDGNGIIESCAPPNSSWVLAGCEVVLFWSDLSMANLISGTYNTATDTWAVVPAGSQGTIFPPTSVGAGNFVTVWDWFADNWYAIGGLGSTGALGQYNWNAGLTPLQAFAIDSKIDDGTAATTTTVWPFPAGAAQINTPAYGPASCALLAPGFPYNTAPPYGDQYLCNLNIEF